MKEGRREGERREKGGRRKRERGRDEGEGRKKGEREMGRKCTSIQYTKKVKQKAYSIKDQPNLSRLI